MQKPRTDSGAPDRRFHGDGFFRRVGATTRLSTVPGWKREADFLFVQTGFSLDAFVQWRASLELDVPVYAGVLVLASAAMGLRLRASAPQIEIPDDLLARLETDRNAGVDVACELVEGLRASGAFDGVHLVPVGRYREVAARLEGRSAF